MRQSARVPPIWSTEARSGGERHAFRLLRYRSECHYIMADGMEKAVSAANAPVAQDDRAAKAARSALFARLTRQKAVTSGRWTRDELYDAP